jgi:8-oxo-dGTP diphosphatase
MQQVVAALIVRDGRLLICQRTQDQSMPLQWEFPGGKTEAGEPARAALRRELEEELGITAVIGSQAAHIIHQYAGGDAFDLLFFLVHIWEGEVRNRIFRDVRWVSCPELAGYDFLEADQKLVQDMADGKIKLWE